LTDNFASSKDQTPEKEKDAKEREKKWSTSIKALITLLKSWTGLICLASHPLGLKSFVDALRLPFPELHVNQMHISVYFI
jgi:hypothetical protein